MPCLKCGRNLEEGQSFCSDCLENMIAYPVKPGTPIQLPPRQPALPAKPKRKKQRKPEEEIRHLRSSVRLLMLILIVTLLAFGMVSVFLLILLEQRELLLPI